MTSVASCLLALACLQEVDHAPKANAAKSPEVPKAFAQLPTMQRMLQQKLQEKWREIGPESPQPNARGGGATVGASSGDATSSSVAGEYVFNRAAYDVYSNSRSEYVPGLAAIVSLSVPVRTELVEETKEKKKGDGDAGAAPKSDDDAAWEALAHNESQEAAKRLLDLARENEKSHRSMRFAPAAVEALERTLLDTAWRFGHKLELEHGERLAIVVEARPAARNYYGVANAFWSTTAAQGAGTGNSAPAGGEGAVDTTVGQPNYNWTILNATQPPSFRLVIQVSADDLAAFHDGRLERDEIAKRTRVQKYVVPSNRDLQYGMGGFWGSPK